MWDFCGFHSLKKKDKWPGNSTEWGWANLHFNTIIHHLVWKFYSFLAQEIEMNLLTFIFKVTVQDELEGPNESWQSCEIGRFCLFFLRLPFSASFSPGEFPSYLSQVLGVLFLLFALPQPLSTRSPPLTVIFTLLWICTTTSFLKWRREETIWILRKQVCTWRLLIVIEIHYFLHLLLIDRPALKM